MTLPVIEAVMNLIKTRSGAECATRVFYEGLSPEGGAYPFATVQEVSFAPGVSHAGDNNLTVHIIGVNVMAKSLEQLRIGMTDADRIMEVLHGRKISATRSNESSVSCACICQGGTTFKDDTTKEIVVQRTYQITHTS